MGKVTALLPATIGAAIGIYLTLFPAAWKLGALGALLLVLAILLYLSRALFATRPIVFGWLIEVWMLFLPVATGLLVYLMIWLTTILSPGDVIASTALTPDQKKDVIKYGVAAIGVLLSAAVAGDPAKAENPFWPSSQFKQAASAMAPDSSIGDEIFWYAAASQCTRCNEVCGWGFAARRFRAAILDR